MSNVKLCPLCNEDTNKRIILIPIVGVEEGTTEEVVKVHLDCLLENLVYNPELGIIYCKTNKKG
jgi:hypothetical protein